MKEEVIYPSILVIIILFIGAQIVGADNIFAQDDSGTAGTIGNSTKTYENPEVGISFQYPSNWEVVDTFADLCSVECLLSIHTVPLNHPGYEDTGFLINVMSLDAESLNADADSMDINTPITTLEDFARYRYKGMTGWSSPNVINDNQTTVAGDHPALQMEYTYQGAHDVRHALTVWTIDSIRNKGYEFSYNNAIEDEFSADIPSIRKMLDSIEFIPLSPPPEETPPPKQPSFMDNN
jgi:hypothetical protein